MGLLNKARGLRGIEEEKSSKAEAKSDNKIIETGRTGLRAKALLAREGIKATNTEVYYLKSYETDFDKLCQLLDQRNSLSFSEIAGQFKIKKTLVEEWVQILEDHKFAEVHYPLTGDPHLRKMAPIINPADGKK